MSFYNIAPIEVLKIINNYKKDIDSYIKNKKLIKKINNEIKYNKCKCGCSNESVIIDNDDTTRNHINKTIYYLDDDKRLNSVRNIDELFFHYIIFEEKYDVIMINIYDKNDEPIFDEELSESESESESESSEDDIETIFSEDDIEN